MTVTLYEYDIQPRWTTANNEQIQYFYRLFAESPWVGTAPDRYGFVHPALMGDVIYGLFAQQYRRSRIEYDDNKQGVSTIEADFEHYLFVLDLGQSRLFLQRRKVQEESFPTQRTILDRFSDSLRRVAHDADVSDQIDLIELGDGYTREQFIAAFRDSRNQVSFLDVADFDRSLLPSDFH